MTEAKMICPSCNQEIPDNSKFCAQCGARLEAGGQAQPIAQSLPPAAIYLRRAPQLTAALTKFAVYIDDRLAGKIGNNETARFEVTPGLHTFYVQIHDYQSKKLSISLRPGESLRLVCWPKAFGLGVTLGFE